MARQAGHMATRRIVTEVHDEPHLEGRRVTVRRLQGLVEGAGKPADEVAEEFDLDVADVYAALQYYHTHPEEMEQAERRRREREEEAREAGGKSLAEFINSMNSYPRRAMGRITGSYPEDLELLIEGAVEAGVFGGKSDALREFAREYFDDHQNERIAAAVALYEREAITLGEAARLANVDRWTMRDLLREHGVELRLGLADEADAEYEAEAATQLEFSDADDGETPASDEVGPSSE